MSWWYKDTNICLFTSVLHIDSHPFHEWWMSLLDYQKNYFKCIHFLNYSWWCKHRAYFRHLLCVVTASNALFQFWLAFSHSKSFKFLCCLGGRRSNIWFALHILKFGLFCSYRTHVFPFYNMAWNITKVKRHDEKPIDQRQFYT